MSDGERQDIEAARRGDHAAFRRLVEAHARPLYAVCVRILGDVALAEDAVQDAMIQAYRGLARFDGRAAFATWLHRIAVNAALAILRQRRRGPLIVDVEAGDADRDASVAHPDPTDHAPQPPAVAEGAAMGTRVAHALGALTPLERTAFVLRHLEQYPLEEIAAALESNANACKQAIFRAVRKLRLALAPWRTEA